MISKCKVPCKGTKDIHTERGMKRMSKKNNRTVTEATESAKIQTKYDKKMQRRKEAEKRAKKEALKSKITGIVVVGLLAAFVLSFPIRSYLAVNTEYIKVDGVKINQVEFDYNYALAKASYLNSYGSYLSMYGMDVSTIDTQMYSDELTFGDYFDQLAVQKIIDTKALKAQADAENFQYDTTEEYETILADMKAAAEAEGTSYKEYIKTVYGPLATESRLEDVLKETLYTAAFYNAKSEELMPSAEEITAYYEEHKNEYDSIDYHMSIVEAKLPTTNPDGTTPKDEAGNEVAYKPTEEEIKAAMEVAKKEAEQAEKTVAKDGEAYTNINQQTSYVNSLLTDFLFDESRKAGDTYVAEDTAYNRYLVVSFDGRYRNEAPTADARVIMTKTMLSETILEEWKAGEATEESFIQLVEKYDEAGASTTGGLVTGLTTTYMPKEMAEWLSAGRKPGDTFALDVPGDTNYVLYYVGENDAEWMIQIRQVLLSEAMNGYLDGLITESKVEDPKGNLKYLQVEENTTE